MTLRILTTGGTFDKHYDEIAGTLGFADSQVPNAIRLARFGRAPQLEHLPPLDSLDMQDADRQRLLDACRAATENRLVVIHGTDTMPESAAVLGAAALDKTIVLTGAMIPLEIAGSDALFNFGFACGVVQTLPAGVYIAMNAQVFRWDNVQKNRSAGQFETRRVQRAPD